MSLLKAELHCHNSFSNYHLGDDEPPYDCDVSIRDQLQRIYDLGIDAVFVTNHNTLDGYVQMLKYKNDHEKFSQIGVYPAEEITTDTGAHVLAYGIREPISYGTPFADILDAVKSQGGVSSAPHPFSLLDALRNDACDCDMIETFNSNNVDIVSNARASQFAIEHNMTTVAGSDSHVLSTLGRCVNVVHSENNLDGILHALKHGSTEIHQTGYTLRDETLDHLRYKLNNSREYVTEYIAEHYPHAKWFLKLLLYSYDFNSDSRMWDLIYRLCVFAMKRISRKVNFQGLDPVFMKQRNIATMFYKAL